MDVNQVGWTANDGHYEIEESATGWTPSEKVRLFRNESDGANTSRFDLLGVCGSEKLFISF